MRNISDRVASMSGLSSLFCNAVAWVGLTEKVRSDGGLDGGQAVSLTDMRGEHSKCREWLEQRPCGRDCLIEPRNCRVQDPERCGTEGDSGRGEVKEGMGQMVQGLVAVVRLEHRTLMRRHSSTGQGFGAQ